MGMGLQKIKKQEPAKPLKKVPKGPDQSGMFPLPCGALDSARMMFFGHSLQMLGNLGGFRWARVNRDLTVTICTHDGSIKEIRPIDLCSRDRRHALDILNEAIMGFEKGPWLIDDMDKEFSRITKEWKR